MLGVCLTLKESEMKIDVERVEIEKETKKMYKVKEYSRVFGYVKNIYKDDEGVIHRETAMGHYIENRVWAIDDGTQGQEQELIMELKKDANNELSKRLKVLKGMEKALQE